MTMLEKVFNSMVNLLTVKIAEQQEQCEALQRELATRPTHEMLAELRKERDEAIQDSLRAQDEVHVLRRQLADAIRMASQRRARKP